MFKFLAAMLIPLYILIYTVQFGRWMRKRQKRGAFSAWTVGTVAFLASGFVFWRMFT